MDVGEVDFNERDRYARQSVAQGYAGMREAGRIDKDEPDAFGPSRLYAIDQHAFMIALQGGQLDPCCLRLRDQSAVDLGQGVAAVDGRLAGSKQIEVGSVEDQDLSPRTFPRGACPRAPLLFQHHLPLPV